MKRGLILLIAFLASAHLGCRQTEVPRESSNASQVPTDGSEIVRTEKGTVIKKSGWQLPVPLPKDRHYDDNIVVVEGRQVKISASPFFPEQRPVVRIPNLRQDGDAGYEISQIIELTDQSKRPYCYQLFAKPQQPETANANPVVTTFFSYLDADGDGIFETLGDGCTVPDWVK